VRAGGRWESATLDAAVGRVARAVEAARAAGQSVLVLDRRPGRVVSAAWRELAGALPRAGYATVPGEGATLATLEDALPVRTPLGIDLDGTRTIVSFGAPLLEGWGRPGRTLAARRHLRVVQVDAWRSPSAALADEWVPIAPGGEGPLALALAHAIARDSGTRLGDEVLAVLAAFAPRDAAPLAGVDAERIETLARVLAREAPAVALGGGEPGAGPLSTDTERAIALLDVVLGSVGRDGGIVARRPVPGGEELAGRPVALADVADGSVGVLLLDGADDGRALPWPVLRRVLALQALVVSLSPFDGPLAREAGVLVPAPAPLECWDEVLPTADASVATYGVVAPVIAAAPGATDTLAFVQALAAAVGAEVKKATHEERLRERVAAIQSAGRGRMMARRDGEYAEEAASSPDAAWETLVAGGCWIDDAAERAALDVRPPVPAAAAVERWRKPASAPGLSLVAFAARGTAGTTPPSPVLTKLYQESDLRPAAGRAAMAPATAVRLGLADGQPVEIDTPAGAVRAALRIDPTLPPERVAVAAGPDLAALHPGARGPARGALPLVVAAPDGTWRETRVRVREA
jgi:anaerobic selenocysteine-containing dehydrogenase